MIAVAYRVLAGSLLLLAGMALGAQTRLYDRLGGQSGVAAIAAALINRVTADPKLGRSFKDTDLDRIKKEKGL